MRWMFLSCSACVLVIAGVARLNMAQNAPPTTAPIGWAAPTSQPTPAPEAPLPVGMALLFDGKTLAGWRQIPPDQWIVKDGALVSLGKRLFTSITKSNADQ